MIFLGNDHGGYRLAIRLYERMIQRYMQVTHHGCVTADLSTDYPVFAKRVCDAVAEIEQHYRGILVCGTGIGMSIAANRYPHIRAALCTNKDMARLSRQHNDANVLVIGGRTTSLNSAKKIIDVFFSTEFEKGRHTRRLKKIK